MLMARRRSTSGSLPWRCALGVRDGTWLTGPGRLRPPSELHGQEHRTDPQPDAVNTHSLISTGWAMEGGADRARGAGRLGRRHLLGHEDLWQEEGGGPRCAHCMRDSGGLSSFPLFPVRMCPCNTSCAQCLLFEGWCRLWRFQHTHQGFAKSRQHAPRHCWDVWPQQVLCCFTQLLATISNPRISSSSSVPARRRGLALKDLGLPQRVQSGRRHRAQPRLPLPRRLVPVLLPRDEMGLPRPRLPRLQPAREGGKRYCAVRDPAQPPSPCPGPRCCSGRGPLPDSPPSRSPHTRLTGLATRAGAMPTDHRASSG